jgi:hypothetical protein
MPPRKRKADAKAALDAELAKRGLVEKPTISAESIADGHSLQLELLTCDDQSLVVMCSRRAGKSRGCVGLCVLTGLKTPNVYCLYLSLTADQSAPRYAECKALLDRFKVPYTPNETDQIVTLANGSRIRFTGTDDRRRIQNLLGDQLASGVVVIDEAQSDPGLLEWLLKDILDPMVSETTTEKPTPGRIVVAGVVPETAAGYFWRIWADNYDEEAQREKEGAAWKCMAWGRADNPHEKDFRKHLDGHLKRYKLEESDPIIQRNWFGRRVFDSHATAYRYTATRNAYTPQVPAWVSEAQERLAPGKLIAAVPPPGVNVFAVGIDPASAQDRFAIVVWGWGKNSNDIYQIAEWVTPHASGTTQSQWAAVLIEIRKHYPGVIRWMRDAGSARETIDTFKRDHNIVVEPVAKGPGSVKARVDRLADLLVQGRAHVISGSELERDLSTCRWSQAEREKGKWVLLSSIPDDVADAATYGLVPYFDIHRPDPMAGMTAQQRAHAAELADLERSWRQRPGTIGIPDQLADVLGPRLVPGAPGWR